VPRERGDNVGAIFGRPATKIWEGQKRPNLAWFLTTFAFDREYLQNGSTYRASLKTWSITQPLLRWGKEIGWTFVHNQKSSRGAYWPTQVNILRETTFRPLQFFTPVRDWPRLVSARPNGTGFPLQKKSKNLKFWPKIQRVSPCNFEASGNIFTNLFQATWWTLVHKQKSYSAHIDTRIARTL